jgi:hypothetical protein
MNIRYFIAALLVVLPPTTNAAATSSFTICRGAACVAQEWRFNALLDDKPIGYHRFALSERGAERELLSEARFNVKFLFINAYSYAHDAAERWQGECLSQLDARTDDNGEKIRVSGTRGDAAFVVATEKSTTTLVPCVQTFAYWNPQILNATRLLNPQTGNYVPVRVMRIGIDTINVRGLPAAAERYRLVSESGASEILQIDLWYSTDRNGRDKQWLALESTTEDSRRLRYQLQ